MRAYGAEVILTLPKRRHQYSPPTGRRGCRGRLHLMPNQLCQPRQLGHALTHHLGTEVGATPRAKVAICLLHGHHSAPSWVPPLLSKGRTSSADHRGSATDGVFGIRHGHEFLPKIFEPDRLGPDHRHFRIDHDAAAGAGEENYRRPA